MRAIRLAVTIMVATAVIGIGLTSPVAAAEVEGKAAKRELYRKGARLWPEYCGQCHKARPGAEFSPSQWDTIVMHMRSRANLSGENARALVQFLRAR